MFLGAKLKGQSDIFRPPMQKKKKNEGRIFMARIVTMTK